MPKHYLPKLTLIIFLLSSLLFACTPQTTQSETSELSTTPSTLAPIEFDIEGKQDILLLSIEENGYSHLFLYQPGLLPLTRISGGNWNDITPAISPDGSRIAFASNRDGFYDIYLLDLQTGGTQKMTDTPQYDSSPTWSPDLAWIAYESYYNDNLEIALLSLQDASQDAIYLTNDPASDHSPAWSPNGRQIAFVSNRNSNADIWIASLDSAIETDRYLNLSNTDRASESHPVWSADGNKLIWATASQEMQDTGIYQWDATQPTLAARRVTEGNWAVWNQSADLLAILLNEANEEYLSAHTITGELMISPEKLPGHVRGFAWLNIELPSPLPQGYQQAAIFTPPVLWQPAVLSQSDVPQQRWYVVSLPDVQAPYPQLHDLVDESFNALRQRVVKEAAWDALTSLENAFVPLTTMLDPGFSEDWLYTGRAFALNSLMTNAGWMVAEREDIGTQTYWRLYIRAMSQDGSHGEPMHNPPWDLSARYSLDTAAYESGGVYAPIPSGYWVDVTSLAQAYQWERLPSLSNWRNYYRGTRFTEFVLTTNLSWYQAMLELYPAEVLSTPTRVMPPTLTPSKTPAPSSTAGPSSTPRPSATASNTPTITFTPAPTFTPEPTSTPPTIIP